MLKTAQKPFNFPLVFDNSLIFGGFKISSKDSVT